MTTIKRYLISAPPRVGGNLFTDIIKSTNTLCVHTHDPQHLTDNDAITGLLIVRRHDAFSAIMSNCIVWHTTQSTIYDQTNINPFEVTKKNFLLQYASHVWHFKNHDLTRPYGLVKTFYFEDFINDYMHVLTCLGLQLPDQQHNCSNWSRPAPYSYKQLIINHQDLKVQFDDLELGIVVNPYIKYNLIGIESGGFC